MENTGLYRGYVGIMENKGLYRGYIGIMENENGNYCSILGLYTVSIFAAQIDETRKVHMRDVQNLLFQPSRPRNRHPTNGHVARTG